MEGSVEARMEAPGRSFSVLGPVVGRGEGGVSRWEMVGLASWWERVGLESGFLDMVAVGGGGDGGGGGGDGCCRWGWFLGGYWRGVWRG